MARGGPGKRNVGWADAAAAGKDGNDEAGKGGSGGSDAAKGGFDFVNRFRFDNCIVKVVEARGIKADDGEASDAFVEVRVVGQTASERTRTVKKTLNPFWDEEFTFPVRKSGEDTLVFKLYDKDRLTFNEVLGIVEIPLASLFEEKKGSVDDKKGDSSDGKSGEGDSSDGNSAGEDAVVAKWYPVMVKRLKRGRSPELAPGEGELKVSIKLAAWEPFAAPSTNEFARDIWRRHQKRHPTLERRAELVLKGQCCFCVGLCCPGDLQTPGCHAWCCGGRLRFPRILHHLVGNIPRPHRDVARVISAFTFLLALGLIIYSMIDFLGGVPSDAFEAKEFDLTLADGSVIPGNNVCTKVAFENLDCDPDDPFQYGDCVPNVCQPSTVADCLFYEPTKVQSNAHTADYSVGSVQASRFFDLVALFLNAVAWPLSWFLTLLGLTDCARKCASRSSDELGGCLIMFDAVTIPLVLLLSILAMIGSRNVNVRDFYVDYDRLVFEQPDGDADARVITDLFYYDECKVYGKRTFDDAGKYTGPEFIELGLWTNATTSGSYLNASLVEQRVVIYNHTLSKEFAKDWSAELEKQFWPGLLLMCLSLLVFMLDFLLHYQDEMRQFEVTPAYADVCDPEHHAQVLGGALDHQRKDLPESLKNLPPGWEMRMVRMPTARRQLFIDHKEEKTFWRWELPGDVRADLERNETAFFDLEGAW